MIRSMTGFGRGERKSGSLLVAVEIRSVNHRHAELRVKVPAALCSMEDSLRQRLTSEVTRGRVDAVVSVSGLEIASPVEVNHPLIAAYLKAASEAAERHSLRGDLTLESILSLPGAVTFRGESGELSPDQKKTIESAFDAAIGDLQSSRAREGKHLVSDLAKRLRAVEQCRSRVARRAKGMAGRHAKRLAARLAEIEGGRAVDPGRLAQEVAILASRSDITEELVRLQGHVRQALAYLKDGGEPVGKKLDFLSQEMHREANTINSKAEDLEISRDALAIKAEVEKIREQVQNIE